MRPRCCFRYLTFLGINMTKFSVLGSQYNKPRPAASLPPLSERPGRYGCGLLLLLLLRENFSSIDPALDADYAIRGFGFGEAVFDVGSQRVQRKPALQVPLGAGDFLSVQAAADADLDPFAAEAQCGVDSLPHGSAKTDSFFELQRD